MHWGKEIKEYLQKANGKKIREYTTVFKKCQLWNSEQMTHRDNGNFRTHTLMPLRKAEKNA